MKHQWIHQAHQPRLTLFFAGWGMDATPFATCVPADSDLLLCYDYRTLDFDPAWLADYRELRVVAWSMGVWAASVVLSQWYASPVFATPATDALVAQPVSSETVLSVAATDKLPSPENALSVTPLDSLSSPATGMPRLTDSVAINGTLQPVDDRYGIPEAIFRGTLEGLNERNLDKFFRRMCATRALLADFTARRPQRPVEELRAELEAIGCQAAEGYSRNLDIGEGVTRATETSFLMFDAVSPIDAVSLTALASSKVALDLSVPTSAVSANCGNLNFVWQRAVMGSADLIFPPAHQQAAWEKAQRQGYLSGNLEIEEFPHYTPRIAQELVRPW